MASQVQTARLRFPNWTRFRSHKFISLSGRQLYGQRQGIEGTISQGVRAFGLRRARYCGLAKVRLQSVATAAAINLDRLGAWFAQRLLAPTRTSRFAAIATRLTSSSTVPLRFMRQWLLRPIV